jgi:hypothetical protein
MSRAIAGIMPAGAPPAVMKHRLSSLLTLLALLPLVAAAALWVRSYWRSDCVNVWGTAHEFSVESRAGYLSFEASNLCGDGAGACRTSGPVGRVANERRGMRFYAVHSLLGFVYGRDVRPGAAVGLDEKLVRAGLKTPAGNLTRRFWYVPFWAVCVVAAAPAALLLWRRHALRRRGRQGLCRTCGYDLRATPGRCPECGTIACDTPAG